MDAARGRSAAELAAAATLSHYQTNAAQFWEGTRRHDVRQNREALLCAAGVGGSPDGAPSSAARVLDILDLGCGPGRDVAWFASKGHSVTALDGCSAFCGIERSRRSRRSPLPLRPLAGAMGGGTTL